MVLDVNTGQPVTWSDDLGYGNSMKIPNIPNLNSGVNWVPQPAIWDVWRPELCQANGLAGCYDNPEVDSVRP